MFQVAGVLKTWGVDEFIACDWTCFLCVEVLANETPWRSDKRQRHFSGFASHSEFRLDFPTKVHTIAAIPDNFSTYVERNSPLNPQGNWNAIHYGLLHSAWCVNSFCQCEERELSSLSFSMWLQKTVCCTASVYVQYIILDANLKHLSSFFNWNDATTHMSKVYVSWKCIFKSVNWPV